MPVTGAGNYFEDFTVGERIVHSRGRTVEQHDNYYVTLTTLNTAQAHFNLPYSSSMMDGAFPERLVVGLCTLGLVIGLTSQDMSENAIGEVGLTGIRIPRPVFAGDTLYASSEVLALDHDQDRDVGTMTYRFIGTNQRSETVIEGERTVVIKKRGFDAIHQGVGG